jgi:hypothetical protein
VNDRVLWAGTAVLQLAAMVVTAWDHQTVAVAVLLVTFTVSVLLNRPDW